MRRIIGLSWLTALVCPACGGHVGSPKLTLADGGTVVFGTPCQMAIENDPTFSGFSLTETTVESQPGNPSGGTVCIANHFQGRASCPYGQSLDANAQLPVCLTSSGELVSSPIPTAPQCVDRRPGVAVTWSCRCDGMDGCACPSGSYCFPFPFLSAVSYCVATSSLHGPTASCLAVCDPVAHPCN